MSEAQGSASAPADPHFHGAPTFFPPHGNGLDGIHDQDLFSHEHDGPAHQSLSPLSMNPLPGTLSRPASMASMTLPPGQTLSRVGSLSNLQPWQPHPLYIQPVYLAPNFQVPQSQGQTMHLSGAPSAFSAGQYVSPTFAMPPGLLFGDYSHQMQPLMTESSTAKSQKKPKARRSSGDDDSPRETKQAKPAKQTKAAKHENGGERTPRTPRSRQPSSAYRGVSKCSKDGRWQARIRVKRQVTYLGRYVNEVDAAKRYDEAAREHHGDKAILNFPTPADKMLGRKQAATVLGASNDPDADGDDDDDSGEDSE